MVMQEHMSRPKDIPRRVRAPDATTANAHVYDHGADDPCISITRARLIIWDYALTGTDGYMATRARVYGLRECAAGMLNHFHVSRGGA